MSKEKYTRKRELEEEIDEWCREHRECNWIEGCFCLTNNENITKELLSLCKNEYRERQAGIKTDAHLQDTLHIQFYKKGTEATN